MPDDANLGDLRRHLETHEGPALWRSLEELAAAPEARRLIETEYPDIAAVGAVDRRTLLRLIAASLALGELAACDRRPVHTGPLLSQPRGAPGYTPGLPLMFATSLERDGTGHGVLVKTHDGRPTKIEGNPLHPASLGATDVFAQAEILSLYDPDRSRTPIEDGIERSWADLERFIRPMRNELVFHEGRGLHILMPPVASPTLDGLRQAAQELFPHAVWHLYGPIVNDHAREGALMAFGRAADPLYDLTRADVLLTLGGDLFAEARGHVRHAADHAARRRKDAPPPRLYAAETCPSLAGARADERVILRPHEIELFARAVLARLHGNDDPGGGHPAAGRIGAALRAAGRFGVVIAGREQPPAVHALAHAINAALAAPGTTVRYIDPVVSVDEGEMQSLAALADAIAAGFASHVAILGANPVHDAPGDLDFARLLRRVPVSVHLGFHRDETARSCRWHVPESHALESWGDVRAFDGTVGLRQPAAAPRLQALSVEQALGILVGRPSDGPSLVQTTWRERWGTDFERRWLQSLEDGVVAETASSPLDLKLRSGWDSGLRPAAQPRGLTAVLVPDASVWDGRYANNGWLQELPRPLTKQVWGNAALIAPATAAAHGLRTGDVVDIKAGGRSLRASIWIMPGHAPGSLSLPLGYGRVAAGRIGNGIGFNAYPMRSSTEPWIIAGVALVRVGEREHVTSTQHHHAVAGEDVVRLVAARDAAVAQRESRARSSIYPEHNYEGYAWGMAIDLDACLGCNACVVACQAENNVAVVGPTEAARGREMHWLRIDRYYAGDAAAPQTYFQPVLCMHCEKAPCEVVCPVNATVHSSEGLNEMVYNRCIGTRTCSNNCPYKVRRFNWFDYTRTDYAAPEEATNPDVTVRRRGVMEKCTYCVQRIGAARIDARLENRAVRDGEIRTACQQACPTQAIVFGDINDPASAVSRLKASMRNYQLLGALNTEPRTTYLARVEVPPDQDAPAGSRPKE